jgi:hypothetical protein
MGRFRRFEARWLLGWAVLTVFLPHQSLAQSHSGFPVDIVAGPMPQPVMADGRVRLLYELHLTNVAPIPIEVVALDVYGDEGTVPLASYRGEALGKALVPAENGWFPWSRPTEGINAVRLARATGR